ncbi:MAG: hypothetical protein WKG01_09960 [Kofleriaceae bacterium]
MSAYTSMADASKAAGGFYVPQFKVVITGASLPGDVLRDIVEVTYKDKLEEIDSCELVVNNWDADHGCFKYIGSEQLDEGGKPSGSAANHPNAKLWTLFDPCNKDVELHLGYLPGELRKMITGNFVTYEPNFPASGPPVLAVRMLNKLHQLRREKKDDQYTRKNLTRVTSSGIAEYFMKEKRLPMRIEILTGAKNYEAKREYILQKSQYDIDFLWQQAREEGFDLWIDRDAAGEDVIKLGPSQTKAVPAYQLMWGQSLIDFKPTLTTGNQYKAVTVRGWDRAAQKVIDQKVELKDLGKINKDLHYLLDQCDPREETVVERPHGTKGEAKAFATSVFADQLKRMVRATGTTVGLPHLRAGCKVQIGGARGAKQTLGSRISGVYFVTATTHIFNSNGYTTRFEARRENEET